MCSLFSTGQTPSSAPTIQHLKTGKLLLMISQERVHCFHYSSS